jgi:hypothetical protein
MHGVVAGAHPRDRFAGFGQGLRLLPVEVERWQEWVDVQMALAGVEKRENVYVTLGLDGRLSLTLQREVHVMCHPHSTPGDADR